LKKNNLIDILIYEILTRRINLENQKKHKKSFIFFSIILAIFVIITAGYVTNAKFRNLIDSKIFNKNITSSSLNYIEINSDDNPISFAYDNYIGILSKNILSIYNNKGNLENDLKINITTPLINCNKKYVLIAEKNGNKFYVINSSSILWQGNVDGKIEKVNINQNGYVCITVSNSTYNSIVIVFDNDGDELFKTFLDSTYAMHSVISNNNEYLAIGEIDYTGTVIKSNIRITSMSDAKTIYTFTAPENEVLTNISYIDKNIAICAFSKSIYKVSTSNSSKIYDISDNIAFANINMENVLGIVERQSSGLFSYEYQLKLKNFNSNNENLYILNNALPKKTVSRGKFIALNYGSNVDIVNQNGSLKKSYTSNQQIKDIILGEHIAGIVYKDKIEVISL